MLSSVESDHQATGQVVFLLPPDSSGPLTPSNLYPYLQPTLTTVATVIATEVMSKDTERAMASQGSTAEYDVALTPGDGPLLVVTAVDKDPAVAVATRDDVLMRMQATLDQMQDGFELDDREVISIELTNVSREAQVLPGSRLRALVGTVGACLLLLVLVVYGLDGLLALHPRRRGVTAHGEASRAPAQLAPDEPAVPVG